MDNDQHSLWADDEAALAATGQALFAQNLTVTVRIPRTLAEAATQAWDRDDAGVDGEETHEQAQTRSRAGVLALIGLAIREHSNLTSEAIEVELPAWHVPPGMSASHSTAPTKPGF